MAPPRSIDLNADLGEEAGDDAALLGLVTSANVACGAHAGSAEVAVATARAARSRGVILGAHPGHADREHFGRRALPITADGLARLLAQQLDVFAPAGAPRYLKLHGALYHQAAADPALAAATVVVAQRARLALLGPPGSLLLGLARDAGVVAVAEGFADRGYRRGHDGRIDLIPRGERGATLTPAQAAEQAVALAQGTVAIGEGGGRAHASLAVGSLCIHGDGLDAVETARRVRAALSDAGVGLRAFAA